MQTVLDDPIIRIWSRNARPRRGARARDALARRRVDRGSARGRRHRLHRDRRRASRSSSSSGSRRARTSMPPGAFPDGKSRELSTATVAASRFFVDRRESTLNEAGDYRRRGRAESGFGPEHIVGGARRAAQRHRRGPALGRRADGVQVDGDRRRGSRRGAALRRAGARARRRRRGRLLIPLADDRGCPRAHRRRRRAHAARPAAGAGVAGRDLAQARVPAADRLVQDPRRRERDPLGTSPAPSTAAC